MADLPKLTPWWIINAFAEGGDPDFSPGHLSSLLSHQLEQWTRHSGANRGAGGRRWWHIDTLDLPLPETPVALYRDLVDFLSIKYPLQRNDGQPPNISGPIDNTTLRIAVVGDARDPLTRAYLHCLGRLIRLEGGRLFDPIDFQLLALVYLPHNAHTRYDSIEIARFLTEIHTMMLQPGSEGPFDWVQFIQDKNFTLGPAKQSGYDQLSSAQAVELMAQTLFHSMISEGSALREVSERHSPAYLSMGAVAIYYNWDQHKQQLAEKASLTLLDRFAKATEPPYTDEEEARRAVNVVRHSFLTRSLLEEMIRLTKSAAQEERPAPTGRALDEAHPPEGALPEDPRERIISLYEEALRLSSIKLERSRDIMWEGGWNVKGTERMIIESVRGVFTGRYENKARAMEQAVLVLKKLEALFEYEQEGLTRAPFDDMLLLDLLEPFDLDAELRPRGESRRAGGGDPPVRSLALLQFSELLSLIPLWAKILTGVVTAGSSYLLYRRAARRRRAAQPHPAKLEDPKAEQPALTDAERREYQEKLRWSVRFSVSEIYVQAIKLVRKLEGFIEDVREHLPDQQGARPPAYLTTTFCRSVFDELTVPGRPSYGRLISNGDFAPRLNTGEQLVRFDEIGHNELRRLINQSLNKEPEVAAYLAPQSIRLVEDKERREELSVESANKLSTVFYDFAYDLYGQSRHLSIDDALEQVREVGTQGALVSYVAEAARPPVIFNRAARNKPPAYVEFKYHSPDHFKDVFAGHFNGQWGDSRMSWERGRNGDILSVGVYQPIPVSSGTDRPSLDSINTVHMMDADMRLTADEAPPPSLVFTLGTLTEADGPPAQMALVSALDGLRLLPPQSFLNDVSAFIRQVRRQPLPFRTTGLRLDGEAYERKVPLLMDVSAVAPVEEVYDLVGVARLKDHPPDSPLRLNREYTLQAALRSVSTENFPGADRDEETFVLDIVIHAEDIEVQPTWIQSFTFKRGEDSPPVEFQLRPALPGHKTVSIEFLHQRRWLMSMKFEVEVVGANEPVLTP